MKSITGLLTALLLFFPVPVFAADKFALLIGVTTYEHAQMNRAPLKYPEADATAVAELLEKSGYTVKVLLGKQATQEAIQEALKQTEGEGTADGVVLIGMFGHGVQYGNDAYYGPFDTAVRKVVDFKGIVVRDETGEPKLEPEPTSMISMRSILDALTVCGAGSKVLLADCLSRNSQCGSRSGVWQQPAERRTTARHGGFVCVRRKRAGL